MRIRDWDRNLKIRLFGEALMNITFWMFFPFLTIYFAESFGKDKAGFLLIFSQVFSVFANLLGGYTADRFGRKRMMVISAFGQGIAFLIFAYAVSPWYTSPMLGFICFALVGVFGSIYWPASQAMVADVVPEKDRSSVFAIFYTQINIAVVVGPILGAIFYVKYRFELMIAVAIISILLALVLAKWTRETVPASAKQARTENGKWYDFLKEQIADYKVIIQDKVFLMFIIAGILAAQTFMQLDLLFPVYTKEMVNNQTVLEFGSKVFTVNGEQAFGLILSENGLLVALFTVAVTKWVTRFPERNVFVLSSFVYAVSILMFGATHWIWGLILAMAVFTLAELMTAGLQQTFISNLAPEKMRGQYFAAASLRYTIGRTIAPISIPLTVWIGYGWTFTILSILAVLSAVLFWVMFRMYENRKAADV
ncbi:MULTISPECIES: MFS transporter [unclassified Mesobacillus]|uniref:MDR family MFS transporter n=1 Tax=unclassified Mesobacillus TaxID=2675270 RepID=UPI00203D2946|nr:MULTISPECIES: MFS transporter [unclassified Mesobacillus]MCM3125440.1 MFS transporter [Mesobacillus sp. MER 33]MCM3234516.1 MFS transporter [Mesobacillus sp. MER 48]